MYRLMQPSDKAAVLALWQRERGESEEFAANAVERFAGQQNVYVAEENDAIAAVALAVPVTLQGRQGSYLYGLCGQGSLILAGLLDYLCAQQKLRGAGFTVAVPAGQEQAALLELVDEAAEQCNFVRIVVGAPERRQVGSVEREGDEVRIVQERSAPDVDVCQGLGGADAAPQVLVCIFVGAPGLGSAAQVEQRACEAQAPVTLDNQLAAINLE